MGHPLPITPGKIVAVHANYRARALERGGIPSAPSYFLKPSSSLVGSGDEVVRPPGCELLTFEGEVALVVGERARRVPVERAWEHVEWVTAANDVGAHDLRYADRGSNVRSKGADTFTPLGPELLPAQELDWRALRLRTWLNGSLVQEAELGSELIFGFDVLVADLSRHLTLEPGDVILTGTPTGASVVGPGDVVEVEVDDGTRSTGRLRNAIVQGDGDLAAVGAQPRADDAARVAAGLPPASRALDPDVLATLAIVSTATLSMQLRRRGLQHMAIEGLTPTRPDLKLVGLAKTLRYLPLREDVFATHGEGMNAQKRAVESIEPGDVLVVDARGDTGAGTIGDVMALRVQQRGGAGIVTDGGLRDSAAVARLDIPAYFGVRHPAVLGRRHVPWEQDVAIACGGVLVRPGDVLVGDEDGVVVVPPELAAEVAEAGVEQERQERFIAARVAEGEPLEGLYPLGPAWRAAYEEWRKAEEADMDADS